MNWNLQIGTKYHFNKGGNMDDPLDIFDPKHIYPKDTPTKKEEKTKSPYEMNRQELREYYRKKREEDKINRTVNKLHIRDDYVRRLEDQLVNATGFINFHKLEDDFKKYKLKVQEVNNATKKETTKT